MINNFIQKRTGEERKDKNPEGTGRTTLRTTTECVVTPSKIEKRGDLSRLIYKR